MEASGPRVRGLLEDRAARHVLSELPAFAHRQPAAHLLTRELQPRAVLDRNVSGALGLQLPGVNCVDDFTIDMFNDAVRAQRIGRFTGVARPPRGAEAEIDVSSPS